MIKRPDSCRGCPLDPMASGFMRPAGDGSNGVLIVAEALGEHEASSGTPLVGPAGFCFGRAIQRVKSERLKREEFTLANTIWCRPPNNKLHHMPYEAEAIAHCAPYLDRVIEERRPKVIVPMGDVALGRILQLEGILQCRGYVFWSDRYQCWVVPTMHPSYVLQGNARFSHVMAWDVAKAVRIAREGYAHEDLRGLICDPSPSGFERWVEEAAKACRDGEVPLATDIETPRKQGRNEDELEEDEETDESYNILRISFAFGKEARQAVSVPYEACYLPGITYLLGGFQTKLVWNRTYDVPRLTANGVRVRGRVRDSMQAWHVLHSDLPKRLGFVTPFAPSNFYLPMWKHESEGRPAYYNAIDSLALWRTDAWIISSLREAGMLEMYQRHIEDGEHVCERMSEAGLLVDQEAHATLAVDVERELTLTERRICEAAPLEVRRTKVYERPVPEGQKVVIAEREGGGEWITRVETRERKVCAACGTVGVTKPHVTKKRDNPCYGAEMLKEGVPLTLDTLVYPFVPSSQQLLDYAIHKGFRIFYNYKTKQPTMNEEAIERMLTAHPEDPVLSGVGRFRELQRIDSNYVRGLPIALDGRVHTRFTRDASTLRYTSKAPAMQNLPRPESDRPGSLYPRIRTLFVAAPGKVLGARDFSGIEAVLVGYFAHDPIYLRVARLGVHAFFASQVLKRPADLKWSDADLSAYFKEIKKAEPLVYAACKQIVHGSNYLETPFLIAMQHPDLFPAEVDAAYYQDFYFDLFPSIRRWQEKECEDCNRVGYVRNPFGYTHRYYYVFEWHKEDGKWENTKVDKRTGKRVTAWGQDAKRLVAMKPQSAAAGIMTECLLTLDEDPLVAPYLRLTLHDEILWESPIEEALAVDERVKAVMERPIPQLPLDPAWGFGDHLSIFTEGKVGARWGEMR